MIALLVNFIDIRGDRPRPYLFANSYGSPPTASTLYLMIRKTMERADIVK
jgi:hypothetical protein